MVLKKLVIGSQVFFAREGTVIGENTVGKGYKPVLGENNANWDSLGECRDFTPNPKIESVDVYAPSPGAYQRSEEVVTSRALDLSLSLQDISPLLFESLMLGKPGNDGTYLIGSGTGKIRGWLKVQNYNQADVLQNVFDVFVSMSFKSAKMENKLLVGEVEAKVLHSTLNTGDLSF